MDTPLEERPQHACHLQNGRNLSNDDRAYGDPSAGIVDDDKPEQQQNVAPNNRACKPQGEAVEVGLIMKTEQHDARYQQQFVSERIKDLAQFAVLVVSPGDVWLGT